MNLTIINGSPRGKKSNSSVLIEQFIIGYSTVATQVPQTLFLANNKDKDGLVEQFECADAVIVIFPLYTDCMPSIVMDFFERIHALKDFRNKPLGFIVQSGFPEGIHCEAIEKYLEKFAIRHGARYVGTITKGGVEGVRMLPKFMSKPLFVGMQELGIYFARYTEFSNDIKRHFAEPYKASSMNQSMFKLMRFLGVSNMYWNKNLKKNGVYKRRFAAPLK